MTAYLLVTGLALLVTALLFGVYTWGALRHAIAITLTAVFLVTGAGISFATWSIGTTIDRNMTVQYKEYWNGFELSAEEEAITCRKNGRCRHTYQCDPKQVPVTTTDSEGNTTTTMKTEWDSCPYAKEETTYSVNTTLGDFVYARNVVTGDQFRMTKRIPSRLETSPPKEWVEAKKRLDNGEPRGVITVKNINREPLQQNISEEIQESIDSLEKDWFLPYFPDKTTFDGKADKAHFVHYEPEHDVNEDLAYLNAALAVEDRDIDVHVVFVHDNLDIEPELYSSVLSCISCNTS